MCGAKSVGKKSLINVLTSRFVDKKYVKNGIQFEFIEIGELELACYKLNLTYIIGCFFKDLLHIFKSFSSLKIKKIVIDYRKTPF